MSLYQQHVRAALDEDERIDAMRELLAMSREYFYHIGISLVDGKVGIVRNDFHNVPETMPDSFYYPTPVPTTAPTKQEQYFKQAAD